MSKKPVALTSKQQQLVHEINTTLYDKYRSALGPSGLAPLKAFAESISVGIVQREPVLATIGQEYEALKASIVESVDKSPAFQEFMRSKDKGKWLEDRGITTNTPQGQNVAQKQKLALGDKVSKWEAQKAKITEAVKEARPKAFDEQSKKKGRVKELASHLADHYKVQMGKQQAALDTYDVYQKALENLPAKGVALMSDPLKKEEFRILEGAIQKRAEECFGEKGKDGKVVLNSDKLKDPNRVKLFNNLVKTDLGEKNFDKFLETNLAKNRVANHFKAALEFQVGGVDDKTKEKLATFAEKIVKKFGPEYVEERFNKIAFNIDGAIKAETKPGVKLSDKVLDKLLKTAESNVIDSLKHQQALEDRGLKRPSIDTAARQSPEEIERNKGKKSAAEKLEQQTTKVLAEEIAARLQIDNKTLNPNSAKALYAMAESLTKKLGAEYLQHQGNIHDVAFNAEKEISKKQSIFSRKTVTIPEKSNIVDKVYAKHQKDSAGFYETRAMEAMAPKKPLEPYVPPKPVDPFGPSGGTWKPGDVVPSSLSAAKHKTDTPPTPPPVETSYSYQVAPVGKPKTEQEAVQKLYQDIESRFMFGPDIPPKTQGQFKALAEKLVKDLGANYTHDKSLAIAEEVAAKVKDVTKVPDSLMKDVEKGVKQNHGAKAEAARKDWQAKAMAEARAEQSALTPEKRAEIAKRAKDAYKAEQEAPGKPVTTDMVEKDLARALQRTGKFPGLISDRFEEIAKTVVKDLGKNYVHSNPKKVTDAMVAEYDKAQKKLFHTTFSYDPNPSQAKVNGAINQITGGTKGKLMADVVKFEAESIKAKDRRGQADYRAAQLAAKEIGSGVSSGSVSSSSPTSKSTPSVKPKPRGSDIHYKY